MLHQGVCNRNFLMMGLRWLQGQWLAVMRLAVSAVGVVYGKISMLCLVLLKVIMNMCTQYRRQTKGTVSMLI